MRTVPLKLENLWSLKRAPDIEPQAKQILAISMAISSTDLQDLNDALVHRRIGEGFSLANGLLADIASLSFSTRNAASCLLCIAQWVDVGYRDLKFLDELLSHFSDVPRAELCLSDYVSIRMAEGYRAFASEDASQAIRIFQFVLQIEHGVVNPRLRALAHYWKARAHRQLGDYELALQHITSAKKMTLKLKLPILVAEMKIHESWMLFQRGLRQDAFRLLDEAESVLRRTDHSLALGNIESARGRFVRRSGEYGKALAHFERAVRIFTKDFPTHPSLARTLVNAAYVQRLIALDLKSKSNAGRANAVHHARYLDICAQALSLLERAGAIYSHNGHQAGTGSVFVNIGHLHLDSGDIDRADDEAEKAFLLGSSRKDYILMARARTLRAAVHNERAEEQVGELSDVAVHANLARRYSEQAIELAKLTQNKRLLAGAYIALSSVAANDFFEDWETAKEFASLAGDLLSKDDRDHLSQELAHLKTRILRSTGIDEVLRSWSSGLVGNKTFQQLTEEFAELIIPKIWAQEDYKITRVAKHLSMSPKKVRRILANTGHTAGMSRDRG
jgi:tetratricopeptide (TPR) repeat protein